MRAPWLFVALVWFATGIATPSEAQNLKDWGVVLLHGKSGGSKPIDVVASTLRSEGAKVSAPTMSWVKSYSTYNATLDEIARHVAALRGQGAKRIALVGQSLGANVALGYAARREGIDAVVAMAPGHQPDRFLRFTQDSLQKAKQMVGAGRGEETAAFIDVNQGKKFEIRTTAAAYVSFFDPEGPALMRRNAANLKAAKLLWVIGSDDANAQAAVTGGKTINVEAGHRGTARAGATEIAAWLKNQ